MTETEYFTALQNLLDEKICQAVTAAGGHYMLQEPGQVAFELNTRGLGSHKAIRLEKLRGGDWPCFKVPHDHAHKRCDSIIASWDRATSTPRYLMIELKSANAGTARKQLGASLAFCHFVHRMVCVGQPDQPHVEFAAVTVLNLPFALKTVGVPTIPNWSSPALQTDCKHMRYDRNQGSLQVAAVMAVV